MYANYGTPADFDALAAAGVDMRGTIVLVRYGRCFRGLKAMNAQCHGAAGVLIYSDPADDGAGVGETYPDGPWRPSSAVQRGSVQFNSLCSGDPFRADARYGAIAGDPCGGYAPEDLVPSIPVLPLSSADAAPIMRVLGGAAAPAGFVGDLPGLGPKGYTLGPSTLEVAMETRSELVKTPIWNVVATVPGWLEPELDQPILIGNHRDAWVWRGRSQLRHGRAARARARARPAAQGRLAAAPHAQAALVERRGIRAARRNGLGRAQRAEPARAAARTSTRVRRERRRARGERDARARAALRRRRRRAARARPDRARDRRARARAKAAAERAGASALGDGRAARRHA